MKIRIQKIIADAGIASRRKAEEFITEGRVAVDHRTVTKLGSLADPRKNKITLDGKTIVQQNHKIYIILNKPRGYITSLHDPQNRPTVIDLIKNINVRVFPVGRLDYDAEGIILLTNDGEFAHKLLHPKFGVSRTYLVKVKGIPDAKNIKPLRTGIRLSDGRTLPAEVKFVNRTQRNSWFKVTVTEGRNRLIKRMFAAVGHPVLKLKRIKLGPFSLGDLKPGEYIMVSPDDITHYIH